MSEPPVSVPWKRLRAVGKVLVWVVVLLVAALLVTGWVLHAPRPDLTGDSFHSGERAEALTNRMAAAVGQQGWSRTQALRFTMFGHRYLWDRARGFFEVRYANIWGQPVRVLQSTERRQGRVYVDGERVAEADAQSTLEDAWRMFVNDSFWLVAPFKARDAGTQRFADSSRLLVAYASGGVTPGDMYLWELGEEDLPRRWRMWVSVLPVGGLPVEWSGWVRLETGARVATIRRLAGLPVSFRVSAVEGAESLAELSRSDPFLPLMAEQSGGPG